MDVLIAACRFLAAYEPNGPLWGIQRRKVRDETIMSTIGQKKKLFEQTMIRGEMGETNG